MAKSKGDGMISEKDYKQAYEETVMAMLEGLMRLARTAKIEHAPMMVYNWARFYYDKA